MSYCKKALAECSINIVNAEWIERLETLKEKLNLKKHIKFVFSDYFTSPFTFGHFSPTIVLPAFMENFSEEEWDFVFRHELNHIKSRHMGIKFIALIANFVHFFNPFAYLLRYEISNMCKIDCGCKTIKNYDTEKRQKYSEYIIDTASNSRGLCVAGSIGLIGDRFKKK
jgi:beta-lactamase regulating signal transducer with metallopeptidase domain